MENSNQPAPGARAWFRLGSQPGQPPLGRALRPSTVRSPSLPPSVPQSQPQPQPTPQAQSPPKPPPQPKVQSTTKTQPTPPPLPTPEAVAVAAAAAAASALAQKPPQPPASRPPPPTPPAPETLPRQPSKVAGSPSTAPPQQPPPKPSVSRSPPPSPSPTTKSASRPESTRPKGSVSPPPEHEPEPQLPALGPPQAKTIYPQNGNISEAYPKLDRKNGMAEGGGPTAAPASEKKKQATRDDELLGMRMLTLTVDNKGAHMNLGGRHQSNSFSHGNGYHLDDLKPPRKGGDGRKSEDRREALEKETAAAKSKTKPMTALVNSNVQSVNNSLLFNTSCTHHSPGVHITLSSGSSRHPEATLSPPRRSPATTPSKWIAGGRK